ncbi:MAG: hydrogenase iron-sulfur subunit [Desulfobulbus oligotrophicus]|jgi:Fe-S oxidoreductase/coenzyme F420-reducing hydrogenase delta subunit|nr:hydrogenase iron-sulfur subunit [Desulfobulbus oligotrophicus]
MANKTDDKTLNILLFLCNWGAHAAFLTLQDQLRPIPHEIRMVRVPCAGRIDRAMLLKAFAQGADGVALVGCEPGTCRYGSGSTNSLQNTDDVQRILDIMGLGRERLCFGAFLPEESEELLSFLQNFADEINVLGPAGIEAVPVISALNADDLHQELRQLVAAYDIHACQDCGKCTSACPLALIGKPFSPRAIASAVITGGIHSPGVQENVWSCLTCGLCYDRCPSAVNFPAFIKELRHLYRHTALPGQEVHGGFFHSLMRSMSSAAITPRRWGGLPDEIRTDPESPILFFGGCAPYYDIFFGKHSRPQTNKILIDSLRLLNFFDVAPRLLTDERCCGHDLLWSGDKKNFRRLARINVERLNGLGIETVITTCPECYMTLHTTYADEGLELKFKVVHLYDFLEEQLDKGAVDFEPFDQVITFQDSCRLGRLEGKVDLPRKLLKRLQPARFVEMKEAAGASICCGNCAWTGCDGYSKALQVRRLEQAHATGSDLLVTSCPKCQLHLACAMEDPFRREQLEIELMDLTSIIAQTIRWKG